MRHSFPVLELAMRLFNLLTAQIEPYAMMNRYYEIYPVDTIKSDQ